MSVGRLATKAFLKRNKNYSPSTLFFGLADENKKKRAAYFIENSPKKIVVAVAGEISKTKGQDIFLAAIEKLPKDIRTKCIFILAGELKKRSDDFGNQIAETLQKMPDVIVTGYLKHEKLMELYPIIDLLITPSRFDSMSIVTIEGFMFAKPCIVSDGAGICDFIEDGMNGYITPAGDSHALERKIEEVLKYPQKMKLIGLNGRKIFEKNFSESIFQRKVFRTIDSIISAETK